MPSLGIRYDCHEAYAQEHIDDSCPGDGVYFPHRVAIVVHKQAYQAEVQQQECRWQGNYIRQASAIISTPVISMANTSATLP